MKKLDKIMVGLMLSVAIVIMVGCPNNAGGDKPASGDTGGATNNFAGRTYGVRLANGARYYDFEETNLTITEETIATNPQIRVRSRSVANQTVDTNYFLAYKGPYTADGTEVSWKAMNGNPIKANFDIKDDGSYSVETTTTDKDTGNMVGSVESLDSNQNVDVVVTVPEPPENMYTSDKLIGTWQLDSSTSYMEFTESEIIFCNMITHDQRDTFVIGGKEAYFAQFGKDKLGAFNQKAAVLKLNDLDPNNPSAKTFDVFITFSDNNTFTAFEELLDENGNPTLDQNANPTYGDIPLNFTKVTDTSSLSAPTTQVTASDLYGTWKGTTDWGDGSIEITYILNANTFRTRLADQPGFLDANITYAVNGSGGITVNGNYTPSQGFPFEQRIFTFLNNASSDKNAIYSNYDYAIFKKQTEIKIDPTALYGTWTGTRHDGVIYTHTFTANTWRNRQDNIAAESNSMSQIFVATYMTTSPDIKVTGTYSKEGSTPFGDEETFTVSGGGTIITCHRYGIKYTKLMVEPDINGTWTSETGITFIIDSYEIQKTSSASGNMTEVNMIATITSDDLTRTIATWSSSVSFVFVFTNNSKTAFTWENNTYTKQLN